MGTHTQADPHATNPAIPQIVITGSRNRFEASSWEKTGSQFPGFKQVVSVLLFQAHFKFTVCPTYGQNFKIKLIDVSSSSILFTVFHFIRSS